MRASDELMSARKPFGIRTWLLALALTAALPVLVFAWIAAQRLATAERHATLIERERRTDAISNKVERYLQSLRELAVTLAATPMLQTGDLKAFYDFAKRAMEAGKLGRAVALADPDGRMLLITRRPFGELLPPAGDLHGLTEALSRKSVHFGDLFTGAVTGAHVFTAWAPVIRDGQIISLVGVTVEPQDLSAVLREERLHEGWTAVVIDRLGRFVARTHEPEKWVGQTARPEVVAAQASAPRGTYPVSTRVSVAASAYFIKSAVSGWTVAVAVPDQLLDAPVSASRRFMLGLGLASLMAAGGLSFLVGRHMSRQVAGVARTAIAVGEGRQLTPGPSGVRELDDVSGALTAAHGLIVAREAALRESESRLRLSNEAAEIGTFDIDVTRNVARYSPELAALLGVPDAANTGVQGAFERVHRDDIKGVRALYDAALAPGGDGRLRMEFRFVRPGGEIRWLWFNGQVLFRDSPGGLEPFRIVGACVDITERKHAEEHTASLMKEVNHRAKNLLAVAQAVARLTASAPEQKEYAERFSERLAGLAASHDLLVRSEWQGVDAGDLVLSQLAHFADLIGGRVILDGPPVHLTPSAAQPIGMVIHELATNAGKYGALSNAQGSIRIAWELAAAPPGSKSPQPRFRMQWSELGGPSVAPPERRGYGYSVIVGAIEHSLGADVSLTYPASGLIWQMEAPADRICTKAIDRVPAPARN